MSLKINISPIYRNETYRNMFTDLSTEIFETVMESSIIVDRRIGNNGDSLLYSLIMSEVVNTAKRILSEPANR